MIDEIKDAMEECMSNGIENVDTAEFGAVADIYKDLMMAMYYEKIIEAMEKSTPEEAIARTKMYYTTPLRDAKEGLAYKTRRGYMETKEIHAGEKADDKQAKMQALEEYIKDLSKDLEEMMVGMDSAEKAMLKTRLSNMATRIV